MHFDTNKIRQIRLIELLKFVKLETTTFVSYLYLSRCVDDVDLMDITCTEKIHEMKINQLWVYHVQRDRESPYISTYVAMSYFIGMANRGKERVIKGMERERGK